MGDGTGIEWTDATWNPLRGCTPVSEGCRNCYAAGQAARFSGPGQPYEGLAEFTEKGPRWTGEVREVPEHLGDPLRWAKPRRVFVNSMSDLFHPAVSREFIERVFGVMGAASQHTFQVLTKRPDRMATLLAAPDFQEAVLRNTRLNGGRSRWPLPNVWLGTSIEDQKAAETRLPALLKTPAAVRFLSCEPLLAPLWLQPWLSATEDDATGPPSIAWVICGGESGHGARRMDLMWARDLRDQCSAAGVAFFFKQTGAVEAVASKKGGTEADIPLDLMVREFPVVRA